MSSKPSQVNKGIKKGVETELFKEIVICNRCDKEVEFTLESELFRKCPRCGKKLDRNIKKETKEGKKVIKEDIKRRGKGKILAFANFIAFVGFVYLIVALATNLIASSWWYALIPQPLFIVSLISTFITKQSVSMKVRFYSRILFIVSIVLIVIAVAAIFPEIRGLIGLK